jgi:hypothetical protein
VIAPGLLIAPGYGVGMAGAIAIVAILLIFPSLILISGGFGAAIIGHFLQRDGELRNEGSELLELDD